MSNGEKSGSATKPVDDNGKPLKGIALYKHKQALEMAEKDKRIADLEARLVAMEDGAPAPAPVATATLDLDVTDPLAWVTEDTEGISLVSSNSLILLAPRDESVSPATPRLAMNAIGQGPWSACPFDIGNTGDPITDQNLKIQKANWWFHLLTKRTAETYYQHHPYLRRTKTVIAPEHFKHWDGKTRSPVGTMSPIREFVPLRELLREILQRVGETFLDYGNRRDGQEWDARFPNPYVNKILDVPTQFRTMPAAIIEAQNRDFIPEAHR